VPWFTRPPGRLGNWGIGIPGAGLDKGGSSDLLKRDELAGPETTAGGGRLPNRPPLPSVVLLTWPDQGARSGGPIRVS
jgi:hypothetical protein